MRQCYNNGYCAHELTCERNFLNVGTLQRFCRFSVSLGMKTLHDKKKEKKTEPVFNEISNNTILLSYTELHKYANTKTDTINHFVSIMQLK